MLISNFNTGDMIAFRIVPNTADGQINANRWGLFKVLHVNAADMVTVALYQDIFDSAPKLGWFTRPQPLFERRFPHHRARHNDLPSICTPLLSKTVDLPDAQCVKEKTKLSRDEADTAALRKAGSNVGGYMAWETISMIIDHEDRAKRDAQAWRTDIERHKTENEAKWAGERAREQTRLKGITLSQLAAETPFEVWEDRTQIIPPAYTNAARKRIKAMVSTLAKLGPKPKRGDVRKELKACVEWFNKVDGTMGYAIETEEREDIYRALEEVCWACKQKPLIQEIENWRDW